MLLCVHAKSLQLRLTLCDLWTVARPPPLSLGSLGKNPGVGCRALLRAIFPTQGSNPRISCLPGLAGRFFTSRATWESLPVSGASPGAQLVTNLPAVQEIEETQLQFLGREVPLQKEMATHPCMLAGEFLGQRSLAGYSPWGRKESDTAECLNMHTTSLVTVNVTFIVIICKGVFLFVYLFVCFYV